MKPVFVKTTNAVKFLDGLKALDTRGAREACLMILDGDPGCGKTEVATWWAIQNKAIFLRAKKEWTPAWMLRELLGSLRKIPEHSFEKMFRQAIQALGERADEAARENMLFAVVIDEVDYISRSPRILETLRDLSDMLEIPFVLVGMGKVRHNLTRFPQVSSRVGQYVQFDPSPKEDTAAMVKGLCEVPVKPCLVDFLHKVSGGRNREIKEGIAAIERFGKRNAGVEIGVTEMAGQVLMNDRATGKPIMVRE